MTKITTETKVNKLVNEVTSNTCRNELIALIQEQLMHDVYFINKK